MKPERKLNGGVKGEEVKLSLPTMAGEGPVGGYLTCAEGEYEGQEADALFPVLADLPSSLT